MKYVSLLLALLSFTASSNTQTCLCKGLKFSEYLKIENEEYGDQIDQLASLSTELSIKVDISCEELQEVHNQEAAQIYECHVLNGDYEGPLFYDFYDGMIIESLSPLTTTSCYDPLLYHSCKLSKNKKVSQMTPSYVQPYSIPTKEQREERAKAQFKMIDNWSRRMGQSRADNEEKNKARMEKYKESGPGGNR